MVRTLNILHRGKKPSFELQLLSDQVPTVALKGVVVAGEGHVFPCDRGRQVALQPGGHALAGPRQADPGRRRQDCRQGDGVEKFIINGGFVRF